MSLRNFHLFFIGCAVALALFVGAWALSERPVRGNAMVIVAVAAFAAGAGLMVYERAFLRRWRRAGLR